MKSTKMLFFTAFLCAGVLAQAQVKLSFNPAKGERYLYRFGIEQNIKQTVAGQQIPVNTTIDMLMEMNVKEKNKDEISVDYSYREVVMEVSNPMLNIKYDSKNPAVSSSEPEKLIAQVFSVFVGKTMNVIFKPDGSVLSVSGFHAIMEDILKQASSDSPEQLQQMAAGFLQSFNDDAAKQMFEQSFKIYPDKAVKPSDSWDGNLSFVIAAGISSDIKNKYTLKSVKNELALLDMVSVMEMKTGMGMEGEISGEQKGEMSLNIKTGMLINSTTTGNFTGKISVQGAEILMDMEMNTTVALER